MGEGISMRQKRLIAAFATALVAVIGIIVPASAASASSPYDSQTQSTLVSLNNAMQFYALLGDGTYNGVSAAILQSYGYTPGSTTHVEIYVLSNGTQYWAVGQDTHAGAQLLVVSTSGSFLGHTGTGVGPASVQPPSPPSTAGTTIKTTSLMPDISALGAALAAASVTATDVCDTVLVMPGTHAFGSSLSDQYIECISAAQTSGATATTAFQAMLTVGAVAAIAGAAAWIVGDGTQAPAKPSWADGTNTTPPATLPGRPSTLPNYWNTPSVASVIASKNAALTTAQAQVLADNCVGQMAGALKGDPYAQCENTPIFASGRSDVPQASDHDVSAITSYPSWAMLNYLPSASQTGSRSWYAGLPACAGVVSGVTSCDEYPFWASAQGGPNSVPQPSLAVIDSGQNSLQGSKYGGFVSACHLNSGDAFISAPMPSWVSSAIPTLAVCNGH
ncbi:hypothetical protein [uncultured Leifsonia sp.]|uniref:NucA/NucB deoxyribonuclease domain-containing protein n=1 Tax=uncultured Leifsonia sp. TaxID=340359 RepID=UPI0028D3E18C|nr:hypothetical protein [uncultured Leifsonia sp.]